MSLPCTSPLTPYASADCFEQYAGGVNATVIFVTALPIDPSDGVEVQALIDSGDAVLMPFMKIGINEPSPINAESLISCASEITTNYDRSISLMDAKVVDENITYYNSLNASTGFAAIGMLLPNCDDATRSFYVEETIRFEGGLIVPDNDNAEPQHFSFNAKYRAKSDPSLVTTPTGIFS